MIIELPFSAGVSHSNLTNNDNFAPKSTSFFKKLKEILEHCTQFHFVDVFNNRSEEWYYCNLALKVQRKNKSYVRLATILQKKLYLGQILQTRMCLAHLILTSPFLWRVHSNQDFLGKCLSFVKKRTINFKACDFT